MPDDRYSRNVPDEGYYSNVPDEGYSRNVPDEGYSRNVPDEGYSRNVPDEGYSRNASCALNLISTFLLPITSKVNFDFEKIKFRFQTEHISISKRTKFYFESNYLLPHMERR